MDPQGNPLPGVVARLFGRASAPTGADGSFTIPLGDGGDIPTPQAWPGRSLTLFARGRTFPPVEPKAKGFTGVDDLFVPSWRGPRIQLWWFESRKVAADLPVALTDWNGTIDEGRTDAEGIYEPLWPENRFGYLDVGVEGVPIRYAVRRKLVLDSNPFHVFVPTADRALRMEIEAVGPDDRPVADARVIVHIRGPGAMNLDFRTGPNGRAVARFWLADAEEDPSHATTGNWRAWWFTKEGAIRKDEGEFEKPKPAAAAGRVRIPLGRRIETAESLLGRIPIHVRGAAPRRIQGSRGGLFLSYEEDGPARRMDPDGRRPREVLVYAQYEEGGESYEPGDSEPFAIEISIDGRDRTTVTVPTARIRKSLRTRETIVLDLPKPARLPRWIEVVTSGGAKATGASVLVEGARARRSRMTDTKGRAYVGDLPPGEPHRIVALASGLGEAGEILDYTPQTAEETTRLTLLPAKPLSVRVRRRNGAVPGGLGGMLVDRGPGRLLPPVHGVIENDDTLVFPAASLPLYRVRVRARKGYKVVPAEEARGGILLD